MDFLRARVPFAVFNLQQQQKRIASLFSKPEDNFDAYQAQGLTGGQSAVC